jgi:pilus assembly protein CpaE
MKALALIADKELNSQLSQLCALHHPPVHMLNALPGMLPGASIISVLKPDVVLLDVSGEEENFLGKLERLSRQYTHATIVLLARHQSPAFLLEAMRAGVREVLALPLVGQELHNALDRIAQNITATRYKEGKILSFISCKGGSGTSFISANLAYALATAANKKTLLIDLNLQFGDAALYLSDIKPATTLRDVCNQIHRLDADMLESSLIRVTPNCGILAAANDADPDNDIRAEQIDVILQLARSHYDFILLDIGSQINGVTIRALDASDTIYPVLQQSLPYLRGGRRLLELFTSLGYRKEKMQLIVNRFDGSASINAADIERTLGQRIAQFIPNNFDVVNESINQGMPVLQLVRSSAVSKSLIDFVNRMMDMPLPANRGMIRRLFDRHPTAQV